MAGTGRRFGAVAATFGLGALLCAAPAAGKDFTCGPPMMKHHEFAYTTSTYTVAWHCEAFYGDNRDVHDVTFTGTWDRGSKLAVEAVADTFSYFYKGSPQNVVTYHKKVTTTCQDDPWLYDAPCAPPQVDPVYPVNDGIPTHPSLPKGAHLLRTSGHSGALRIQYEERLAAPKIVTPAEGATFAYPGSATVRVQHKTQFGLEFYVGWRPDAQHAITQVSSGVITDLHTAGGETTAKLTLIKPGQWTIRARLNTDVKAWWSDPHFFKAQEGYVPTLAPGALKLKPSIAHLPQVVLAPAPVTILRPKPDEEFPVAVKVRVQLPAQPATAKVQLKFLKKQGGDWVEKAVLPGYDTAASPAGIDIPKAKLGAGTWRVKAAMDLPNAPWAGPVRFVVP